MLSNGVRLFLGAHFQLSEKKKDIRLTILSAVCCLLTGVMVFAVVLTSLTDFRNFCIPPTEGRWHFVTENFHPFS